MDDAEFNRLAAETLERVRTALEETGADVDVQEKGEGVLELEFADGSKMVVNRHGAAQELWVAARSGGFHFRWDGSKWRDSRSGAEFFAALSTLLSAQSGVPVQLK
ncbi:MAG: iron donor protein CyaY [Betaproteobacteria bacterium]|nr:iron donor protein CyaY [Betaproteobacteria bacterium]